MLYRAALCCNGVPCYTVLYLSRLFSTRNSIQAVVPVALYCTTRFTPMSRQLESCFIPNMKAIKLKVTLNNRMSEYCTKSHGVVPVYRVALFCAHFAPRSHQTECGIGSTHGHHCTMMYRIVPLAHL